MRSLVFLVLLLSGSLTWAAALQQDRTPEPILGTPPVPSSPSNVPPDANPNNNSRPTAGGPAQRVNRPTAPTVERVRTTEDDKAVMRLDTVMQHCVMPDGIVNFSGQGLRSLADAELAIMLDHAKVLLKRQMLNDQQMRYQLSDNVQLQANQRYPLVILRTDGKTEKTKLSLWICPQNDVAKAIDKHRELGQLVLLANIEQQGAIGRQLATLNYAVLETKPLQFLNKVLLVIAVDEAKIKQSLTALRQRLPDVIIDFNSHFQSADKAVVKPRLYAKQQLFWKDNSACTNQTLSQLAVGMIDGEVEKQHPALVNQRITSKHFLAASQQADKQHGTAVAAILVADKTDWGLQGLLPGVTLFSATVLRQQQSTSLATIDSIIQAMDWLLSRQVRLINVSLSGQANNLIIDAVFQQALQQGAIIFAAAGNHGKNAAESYPAALTGVIAVTALDAAKRQYLQANQGRYIDFAAPGVDIWTADIERNGKYRSGTSYATPYAVGIAALYLNQNPSLSRSVLYQAMKQATYDLGEQGHDRVFGWGLLQAPESGCQ